MELVLRTMTRRGNVRKGPPAGTRPGPPGSVRIIAGRWRSRRLAIPEGTSVRPTPDRVRETLFNWLQDSIDGARCLDLYAGTGALGFEALSRGASEACFVERDPASVEALRTHAAALGVVPKIACQEGESFLRGGAGPKYDVVFVDPPYEVALEPLLALLPPWLAAAALVYVERPRTAGLPEAEGYRVRKRSFAGAVEYALLELDATPRSAPPTA